MRTTWYILCIFLAGFSACKKECDKNYTISGTIINGTSDKPYSDTLIVMRVSEEKNFGGTNSALLASGYTNSALLASGYTNSNGEFTLTYKCTDIDGDIQFLMGNWETSLPKNQDITDKILYFSDSATVKVTFKTNNTLMDDTDTLFWAYAPIGLGIFKDTIVGPKPQQYSITFKVPIAEIDFIYSRSSKEFNQLLVGSPQISERMTGDPYTNEVTIEY